jgi:hypothetical protein
MRTWSNSAIVPVAVSGSVLWIRRLRLATVAAAVFALALGTPALVAAEDEPRPAWAPPEWLVGSWGLAARGAVVSVVATASNITVTMAVDGTRSIFDAAATAADGPWRVSSTTGVSDAGVSRYEVTMDLAGSMFEFILEMVSDSEVALLPSVTEAGETRDYGPIMLRKGPK